MILTGNEIKKEVKKGNINIKPFFENQLNPNTYNYRLGDSIIEFSKDNQPLQKNIPHSGLVLKPKRVYLANTFETLGSKKYAMSLIGRSSMGRLGLFLQTSANLGHTGSDHKWTLELVAVKPTRIFKNMIIGQISFWTNYGDVSAYLNGYSKYNFPKTSKLMRGNQ